MTAATNNKSPLLSVIRDGKTAGFVLRRGPKGVEAYTAEEMSIGFFTDQAAAVAAIFAKFEAKR